MKRAIRQIDKAIQEIYAIDSQHQAEDFLMESGKLGNRSALLIEDSEDKSNPDRDVSIGICLAPTISRELGTYGVWTPGTCSIEQLNAFSVATEEVSHFRYLVFHATQGRSVSQFEMEMQGEVDKFLVLFFAAMQSPNQPIDLLFDKTFDQIFQKFSLVSGLSEEQEERYLEANQCARQLVQSLKSSLQNPAESELALRFLRRFYRLNQAERLSQSNLKR